MPEPEAPSVPGAPGGHSEPPADEEYRRVRRELVRAVSRVCPRWLANHAEDIVQVAMMRTLETLANREERGALPSSYLWKAAYSATVDEIRRLRRRQEVSLENAGAETVDPPHRADPEREAVGRELGKAIRECLGRLIRPRRLAVTLYLQEHSVPELSRLLGWSAKKGDNLVYRGLADLRDCLASKGLKP